MRSFGFTGGTSQGYLPSVPPGDPYTVIHAWVGAVSDDGATIKFRSTDATEADVLVSTNPGLTSPLTFSATEGDDDVWTAVVTGLTADTQYYFGFDLAAMTGQFRTWVPEGDQFSFLMAAASCMGLSASYPGSASNTSNPPTFDRIAAHDPLFFLHMGDLHYRNSATTVVATRRNIYHDVLAQAQFADFIRTVPTCYVWDDHDYGANDSNGTSAGKAVSQQVYREYVPHWPLAEGAAIYHSFAVGRVRFINIDSRSGRTANSATDNSSKTRLGTTQKTWLKAELLAATEPVIVLNVMSWIGDTTSFSDGWESFGTERTELFDFFVANSLMERLFLIGGDLHELQYDDGTHTNFETGHSTPGPPYAGFAPIDASFNHFGATATTHIQARKQQYGTLEFTDTGTQITVTAKGYALSVSPGSTSSVQFDHATVFPG